MMVSRRFNPDCERAIRRARLEYVSIVAGRASDSAYPTSQIVAACDEFSEKCR